MAEFSLVYEHEVSFPEGLLREALWQGLRDFVTRPQEFIDAVLDCSFSIEHMGGAMTVYSRTVSFDGFSFSDRVLFREGRHVVQVVPAFSGMPASTYAITDTGKGLRFTYLEEAGLGDRAGVIDLLRRAWRDKDREIVRRLAARTGGN